MNKISKRIKTVSCGIVVIRKEDSQYKYLLLQSYNYLEPPKGKKEDGETDLQAALRETEEETGIKSNELQFKWGQSFKDTEVYGHGKIARFFVAETTHKDIKLPINLEIGKAEHTSYTWATYNQASKLVGARIQGILDWAKSIIDG